MMDWLRTDIVLSGIFKTVGEPTYILVNQDYDFPQKLDLRLSTFHEQFYQ